MDSAKFEAKILESIKESLKTQYGDDDLVPLKLVESRDRYFLIQCKEEGITRAVNRLFVRYEKWFWHLAGMSRLPPEYERREYTYNVRPKGEPYVPRRKRADPKTVNNKLDKVIRKRPTVIQRKRPGS